MHVVDVIWNKIFREEHFGVLLIFFKLKFCIEAFTVLYFNFVY